MILLREALKTKKTTLNARLCLKRWPADGGN